MNTVTGDKNKSFFDQAIYHHEIAMIELAGGRKLLEKVTTDNDELLREKIKLFIQESNDIEISIAMLIAEISQVEVIFQK